jgi:hypothetical protein
MIRKLQNIQEGFIDATIVAMDATHIEARDRQPEKESQPTDNTDELPAELPKKKRGRKSKAERDQWLKEQAELEANRPLFEKKVEEQLQYSFSELNKQISLAPEWGVKKNSEGKNVFWYDLVPIYQQVKELGAHSLITFCRLFLELVGIACENLGRRV